jgi:glutamyl/glutaminyl-tRNA synthetase
MGDPVVRRRDGIIAYNLVVVVDDAASGVSRVVRGRDLASSTATQYQLQELLQASHPSYRHHFLLLEDADNKLAKVRGSMPFAALQAKYSGPALCGLLAKLASLRTSASPCMPQDLLQGFDWQRVQQRNQLWREPS